MQDFIREDYDPINSVFALWIAYEYKWPAGERLVNTMTYFLRYANDKTYDGNVTEINRCFSLLSKRMSLEYLNEGNPMKVAVLYRNKNRGQSIEGVKNPPLFKIECEKGFMRKQGLIYGPNITSVKEKTGFASLLEHLEQFSKSENRLLINASIRNQHEKTH
ncbi:hypothetical protein [Emticicia fontis]